MLAYRTVNPAAGMPTRYDEPEKATCLSCLAALLRTEEAAAALAAKNKHSIEIRMLQVRMADHE